MFGNEDIYRTQADQVANSFTGPQNSAIGGPGWGINANQLTPSYAAPYRPQWAGQGGYNEYTKRGMLGGINQIMPWQNYGHTAPQDNWHQNINSVVESPFDVASFAVQRVAAPIIAFKAANKLLGAPSFSGAFKGQGVGASMGQSIGRGVGSGVMRGAGASAAMAARVGSAVGVAGSVAGAVAMPLAAGFAALEGAERAFFNPYINNAKQAEALHQNFSGITFADARGNASTGRGLGYKEAMSMSQDLTKAGIKDMMFSTGEFKNISDMSMRSGMLDNAKAGDITKRIKDISEQIKLVMAISKDPSVQGAIESLSKLQAGGAMGGKASSAYTRIGMHAAIAGSSVQRMMDTVGAQGAYMYAQNGMTPYLGQMAAASANSAFASANRMGLISSEQLARMGGVEGATQSAIGGQLAAAQTTLGKFMAYNKYMGNGANGGRDGVVGSVANFGASMAQDPTKTMGQMILYGNQASARMMNERGGAMSMEDQLMDIAKTMPNGIGPNGKVSAETAAVILKNKMGLTDDQIHAFLQQRMSDQDDGAFAQRTKAREGFMRDQNRSAIEQNVSYGGPLGSAYGATLKGGRAVTDYAARNFVDPVSDLMASAKEGMGEVVDSLWFGSTIHGKTVTADSYEGQMALNGKADPDMAKTVEISVDKGGIDDLIGMAKHGKSFVKNNQAYELLNKAALTDKPLKEAMRELQALKNDPHVSEEQKKKVRENFKTAARRVVGKSALSSEFAEDSDYDKLYNQAWSGDHTVKDIELSKDKITDLDTTLKDVLGDNTRTTSDNAMLAGDIQSLIGGGLRSGMDDEGFAKLAGSDKFKRLKTALDPEGKMGDRAFAERLGQLNQKVQGSTLSKSFIHAASEMGPGADLGKAGAMAGSVFTESSAASTVEESAKSAARNLEIVRGQHSDATAHGTNRIDTEEYKTTTKQLDDASQTFSDAVDRFVRKVDKDTMPAIRQNQNSRSLVD